MGKIYCIMGKSSSGKDTIFKLLLERKDINLKTIYVSNKWYIMSSATAGALFESCTSIVGGAGTTYDSSNVNKEYARIDDPDNGKPGYFTLKTN